MALGKAVLLAAAGVYLAQRKGAGKRFAGYYVLFLALKALLKRRKRLEENLKGKVAIVTGGSRGIGKGIAVGLGEAGAIVYVTGRSSLTDTVEAVTRTGANCVPVKCDSAKDGDLEALFAQVMREQGRLDILVNVAFSAVDTLPQNAGKPFWEKDVGLWDAVNNVGLRSHYVASCLALRNMNKAIGGLIVNVSSFGGLNYIFDVAYGVGKAGMDRMANDMALEAATENVVMVSLWPGLVKTEHVQDSPGDFAKLSSRRGLPPGQPAMDTKGAMPTALAETPLFSGRAIAALARDPRRKDYSGKIMVPSLMASEFGFKDERGVRSPCLLSLKGLFSPMLKPLLSALGAWEAPGACFEAQRNPSFASRFYWNALPNGDFPKVIFKLAGGNGNIG